MMTPEDRAYVADLALPDGFKDETWRNDTCPSFVDERTGLILYVDHPDPGEREIPECPRFTLRQMVKEDGGWQFGGGHDDVVVDGDDYDEVLSHIIAARFALVLQDWLSPSEWETMRQRNLDTPPDACASHDYCDANVAMDMAIRSVMRVPEMDADDERLVRLWNGAWGVAKASRLTAKPPDETR